MACLSVILWCYRITCLWFCNKRFLCNKKGRNLCQTLYLSFHSVFKSANLGPSKTQSRCHLLAEIWPHLCIRRRVSQAPWYALDTAIKIICACASLPSTPWAPREERLCPRNLCVLLSGNTRCPISEEYADHRFSSRLWSGTLKTRIWNLREHCPQMVVRQK